MIVWQRCKNLRLPSHQPWSLDYPLSRQG
jgi:hypothetical protein